jgi:hypothetical protein
MKDEEIATRLSSLEDLYFPRAVQSTAGSSGQRKAILLDLLRRDPAVFLERYGSQLSLDELLVVDALKLDYEVDWHLKDLRKKLDPDSRRVAVRNRRLAYLNKLVSEGQYFSEDAMRDREPYLHHEYVGKYQDLMARNMARPGERWSETLMRRAEEATLVARIREEQQRLGVAESDWIGNERREEEEEEEEEDEVTALPAEEMQEMMDEFTSIMKQKFLSGEDEQHLDYSKIDNDESLDDHWLPEMGVEAQEKYFDQD